MSKINGKLNSRGTQPGSYIKKGKNLFSLYYCFFYRVMVGIGLSLMSILFLLAISQAV